jgi:Thioredoxin-related protein
MVEENYSQFVAPMDYIKTETTIFFWGELMKKFLATLLLGLFTYAGAHAAMMNEDGLHIQPWFLDSFLELEDDINEAEANNKRVALIIEQRGCIYCKKMHEEVLTRDDVREAITADYEMIQINMFGDREMLDLDGEALPEKEMVRKWGALFTPTIMFLPAADELEEGKSLAQQVKSVMPGAFGRGTVLDMFSWVTERGYNGDEPFQKYHARKIAERRAAQ